MATSSYIAIDETVPKSYDRRNEIFNYGVDNLYPQNVKKIINNSVTAKACIELLGSFIYGKGFDNNDFYVNRDRDTPNTLLRKAVVEASYYKGFGIHVGYNALGEKSSFKLVPFDWIRKSKEDVSGYITKVEVSKDWSDLRKNPITEYDLYNPEQVLNQIERDTIENYKGQILYVSFSEQDIYPRSWVDTVLNDCISEWKSGVYKKNLITKGFMKNAIVVTKKFEDNSDAERFQNGMKSQLGADGVGGINHFQADLESDDLSKEVFIQEIGTDLDDALFQYTDKNVSDKICVACWIPPSLVKNDDNSLFGAGGTAIKEMMSTVQFRTEMIQSSIEEIFNDLFYDTTNAQLNNAVFEIIPLINIEEIKENESIN